MLSFILFLLGLCFGSFVNALVWRTRQHERKPKSRTPSIINGRSMCPRCKHLLASKDLIPVVSWLWLHGRCRYCHKPISPQYPLVELAAALVFVLSYVFWPQPLHGGQLVLFVTWLVSSVGLLALFIYDFKWMILPNRIVYPTFFAALAGQLVYILGFAADKAHSFEFLALSLLVASGIFWLLFTVSQGKWIGYGDVRLGLITGTLLQTPGKSLLMIFMASVLGTAVILPLIATAKREMTSKIAYGPFLIIASFICVLFGQSLIDWYKNLFLA